jgi:hypothetical protein
MKTDSEIKIQAFEILNQYLGMVESERFIALIQRDNAIRCANHRMC